MADGYSSSSSTTYSSNYPSFSSTLLDSIYRSIDSAADNNFNVPPRKTKQMIDFEASHRRRASMIDALMMMQRKNEKAGEGDRGNDPSVLRVKTITNRAAVSDPLQRRPSPVGFSKTSGGDPKTPESGSFLKTKSKALKMYGELKKAKQPISPGKRLAGFLNSLFSGNNNGGNDLKKTKKRGSKVVSGKDDFTPTTTTTTSSSACSSASSFSRSSCLSKTPSSSRKSTAGGGAKRSVKFSSVSTIIDDEGDSRHSDGRKPPSDAELNGVSRINEEVMARVMEENRRAEEAAMDCDCESYASSDLFELDNLSSIGLMETAAYEDDELPVYETTHLQNSRGAFANGTTTTMVV